MSLKPNRSMPQGQVIPELTYEQVREAADWLCDTFGFTIRLHIGDHRAQLEFGTGSVVVRQGTLLSASVGTHSVMVRVDDVDAHHTRAVAAGASPAGEPKTYPFGERQYSVKDIGGHWWTFTQSVDDVDPRTWGGEPGPLSGRIQPKYSLPEIERRWLVDLSRVGSLEAVPFRVIEDSYWTGTRLRLRKVVGPDGDRTYKLGIKYGKVSPLLQPITNLYLEAQEYEALAAIAGTRVRKRRYGLAGGSLNIHEEPLAAPPHFEVEFGSVRDAEAYIPPPFVTEEVT